MTKSLAPEFAERSIECECGNAKTRAATACDRCLAIEAELWRWLPMKKKDDRRVTTTEAALKAFESRFNGMVDWHNAQRPRLVKGRGYRRGPELQIRAKGVRRPPEWESPIPDGVQMTIAQAADDSRHHAMRRVGVL